MIAQAVPPEYIDIAYALGIGILIGLERQHREVTREAVQPEEGTAIGVRTFALLALLGWLTRHLAHALPWLPLGVIAQAVVGGVDNPAQGLQGQSLQLFFLVGGNLLGGRRRWFSVGVEGPG